MHFSEIPPFHGNLPRLDEQGSPTPSSHFLSVSHGYRYPESGNNSRLVDYNRQVIQDTPGSRRETLVADQGRDFSSQVQFSVIPPEAGSSRPFNSPYQSILSPHQACTCALQTASSPDTDQIETQHYYQTLYGGFIDISMESAHSLQNYHYETTCVTGTRTEEDGETASNCYSSLAHKLVSIAQTEFGGLLLFLRNTIESEISHYSSVFRPLPDPDPVLIMDFLLSKLGSRVSVVSSRNGICSLRFNFDYLPKGHGIGTTFVNSVAAQKALLCSIRNAEILTFCVVCGEHSTSDVVTHIALSIPSTKGCDVPAHSFLIDVAAAPDCIKGLRAVYADPAILKLSSDYGRSARCLERCFGFSVTNLWDIEVATRVIDRIHCENREKKLLQLASEGLCDILALVRGSGYLRESLSKEWLMMAPVTPARTIASALDQTDIIFGNLAQQLREFLFVDFGHNHPERLIYANEVAAFLALFSLRVSAVCCAFLASCRVSTITRNEEGTSDSLFAACRSLVPLLDSSSLAELKKLCESVYVTPDAGIGSPASLTDLAASVLCRGLPDTCGACNGPLGSGMTVFPRYNANCRRHGGSVSLPNHLVLPSPIPHTPEFCDALPTMSFPAASSLSPPISINEILYRSFVGTPSAS